MNLYKNSTDGLLELGRDRFPLERDIQGLVENNLQTIFSLKFVASELTVDKFRIDTLAYDEENNSFVIIEYKKGHSYSVVDQGYSYLSVMLNNKAILISRASVKPIALAFPCCSLGSFPATIETKITLSIPNTISNKVRVSKLIKDATLNRS